MMPKKQPEPCMLCGGSPCQCAGGKTKKRVSSSTKKKSDPTSISAESVSATEDVFGEIPKQAKRKFRSESHLDRDLAYESALRNIRGIVCERDQVKIDEELFHAYPQSVDRRIADWKNSHV